MARVTFTLDSAKRISAAVRRVEQSPVNLAGQRNHTGPLDTQLWVGLTGCDVSGVFWDWVAVVPSSNLPTKENPFTLSPADMWTIREPHIAGFGNAREANHVRAIEPGTVVQLTFIGYAPPPPSGMSMPNTSGTVVGPSGAIDPNAPVPMYVFNHPVPPQDNSLPIHDHRDNFNGGFAFSVYHPGTGLPQQRWAL